MVKKLLTLLLCMTTLLFPLHSLALTADTPLAGTVCWPEGTDENSAAYVYRYEYPLFVNDSAAAETVNAHFTYLVDDALAFAVPMTTVGLDPAADRASTEIRTEITCLTDSYLSVLITTTHTFGGETRVVYAAHTFTLQGSMAGSATNLPRFLGLLSDNETDEWLLDRQKDKADALIRKMVWRRLTSFAKNGTLQLDPEITEETLEWSFYPEEDFYLNAQEEPVFFLQPGVVSDVSDGRIDFTITVSEIDDEL